MHALDRIRFEIAPAGAAPDHEEFLTVLSDLWQPSPEPGELAGPWGPPRAGLGTRATQAIRSGERNENRLSDPPFHERHPELSGRRIRPDERGLITEWLRIRDTVVRPALRAPAPGPASPVSDQRRSDTWLKTQWRDYECKERLMVSILVLSNAVHVNPECMGAFTRLATTLTGAGYQASETGAYNCRAVKDGTAKSLHSYGLALDVDPACNPWLPGKTGLIRFSTAKTQPERCREVEAGRADTTFTSAQIAAVESIRTVDGLRVFQWGGRWNSLKDSMHFQIDVSPAELDRGIAAP